MRNLTDDVRRTRWARRMMLLAASSVLLLAGCGDDGATVERTSGPTTTTAPPTTTTTPGDDVVEDGLAQLTELCRDGDVSGCQQVSDATLQEICDEGQTVACQTYGARTGEGDPEGDGTAADEAGCRDGDLEACVQLSDPTLQQICDEGQTAACQVVLSRTGDG